MNIDNPHATCGAKTRSGEPCKRPPMANGRCHLHGGKTPVGAALPQFKHGRYSKHLPTRMMQAYEDARKDKQLLDLNESIALLDARVTDLLSRVDTGESGVIFKDLRKTYYALDMAIRRQKAAEVIKAMGEMDALIGRGLSDFSAWAELVSLLDDRRKHVETQQRLETAGERSVPASEVVVLMGAILKIAQEAIQNADDRRRFVEGIEPLIAPTASRIQ